MLLPFSFGNRIIGSFKTVVRCFQPDRYNVCPDCKSDRSDWAEGQDHDCPDPGPANPTTRRQNSKMRYGNKRKGDWKGWKRNATAVPQATKEVMPERPVDEPFQEVKRYKKNKERATQLDDKPLLMLQQEHPNIPGDMLKEVMTSILLLPPDAKQDSSMPTFNPMSMLQARHPSIHFATLEKIVSSLLLMPPDDMLGKRAATEELSPDAKKAGASSSNNMYEVLSQQDESQLALSELTQGSQPSLL